MIVLVCEEGSRVENRDYGDRRSPLRMRGRLRFLLETGVGERGKIFLLAWEGW